MALPFYAFPIKCYFKMSLELTIRYYFISMEVSLLYWYQLIHSSIVLIRNRLNEPLVRQRIRPRRSRLTQAQLEVYEIEDIQIRRMFAGLINEERAEGYAEGYAKGKAEAKREIAVRLLKENFSFDLIARLTGLSTAEVQSLKK